jgi:hypothetical protein
LLSTVRLLSESDQTGHENTEESCWSRTTPEVGPFVKCSQLAGGLEAVQARRITAMAQAAAIQNGSNRISILSLRSGSFGARI